MLNLYFSVTIYESVFVFFYSSGCSLPLELNILFLKKFSRNPEFAAAAVVV